MLHEIYCEQFHQKRIVFNPGLSVVLGTNAGDNSIGKSTLYYRVVVIKAPLQGLCYTVKDAVDW